MTEEIKLTQNVASAVAQTCGNAAKDLQAIHDDLSNQMKKLRGRWRGEADEQQAARFEITLRKLTAKIALLLSIQKAMGKIIEILQKTDREAAKVGG